MGVSARDLHAVPSGASAVEQAMKVQEVILRAIDGRLKWYQAAEILGISNRQMRRWKRRYKQWGYDGLFDRRRRQPSPKRVPFAVVQRVLTLHRERYFHCNVLHFHESLQVVHSIALSYTWGKTAALDAPPEARPQPGCGRHGGSSAKTARSGTLETHARHSWSSESRGRGSARGCRHLARWTA